MSNTFADLRLMVACLLAGYFLVGVFIGVAILPGLIHLIASHIR